MAYILITNIINTFLYGDWVKYLQILSRANEVLTVTVLLQLKVCCSSCLPGWSDVVWDILLCSEQLAFTSSDCQNQISVWDGGYLS